MSHSKIGKLISLCGYLQVDTMHLTARDKHLVLVDCHDNSVRVLLDKIPKYAGARVYDSSG